jgi:hypothetical protein
MEKDKNLHDFEQFMRRQLEGLDAQAEEDTWANIAAEQRKRNPRLVVRYRAPYILGMTGVLALVLFRVCMVLGIIFMELMSVFV